jgi:hypothetical protein
LAESGIRSVGLLLPVQFVRIVDFHDAYVSPPILSVNKVKAYMGNPLALHIKSGGRVIVKFII